MKIKVGVFFGGNSVEHEVSIITAQQAIENIDREKYEIIPIYITKCNKFYVGEQIGDIAAYRNLDKLLSNSIQVAPVNLGEKVALMRCEKKMFKEDIYAYLDVAFPIVHGTNVEDGTIQGFLNILNIPYVGCDILSSSVGMDKFACKEILRENNIPVIEGKMYTIKDFKDDEAAIRKDIEKSLKLPVIVKPINLGSSVGISIAKTQEELTKSLDNAFTYAQKILVEKAITNLKEVNCSVLGDFENASASECESPIKTDTILSYRDKYLGNGSTKGGAKSSGAKNHIQNGVKTCNNNEIKVYGANSIGAGAKSCTTSAKSGSTNTKPDSKSTTSSKFGGTMGSNNDNPALELPAKITDKQKKAIQDLAIKTFHALGCSGVIRIDFIIDQDTNEIYVNEVNTIPGSLSNHLWNATNMPFSQLLDNLIELALKRDREQKKLTFSFETNILENFSGTKGVKGAK